MDSTANGRKEESQTNKVTHMKMFPAIQDIGIGQDKIVKTAVVCISILRRCGHKPTVMEKESHRPA